MHVNLSPCASLLNPHSCTAICPLCGFTIWWVGSPYQVSCNDSRITIDLHFHIPGLEVQPGIIEDGLSNLPSLFKGGGSVQESTPTAKVAVVRTVVLDQSVGIPSVDRIEKAQKGRLHIIYIIS